MSDPKGWPDAANPGIPLNPERQGPHVIVDQYGKRWWAWWDGLGPNGGWSHATATGNRGLNWTYIGPAVAPDGLPVEISQVWVGVGYEPLQRLWPLLGELYRWGAPAEVVYGYLADMREHHPRFLPPAFEDFKVESGGVGAGTVG